MEQILKDMGIAHQFSDILRQKNVTMQTFISIINSKGNIYQMRQDLAKECGFTMQQVLTICDRVKDEMRKDSFLQLNNYPRNPSIGQVRGGASFGGLQTAFAVQATDPSTFRGSTSNKRISQLLKQPAVPVKKAPAASNFSTHTQSKGFLSHNHQGISLHGLTTHEKPEPTSNHEAPSLQHLVHEPFAKPQIPASPPQNNLVEANVMMKNVPIIATVETKESVSPPSDDLRAVQPLLSQFEEPHQQLRTSDHIQETEEEEENQQIRLAEEIQIPQQIHAVDEVKRKNSHHDDSMLDDKEDQKEEEKLIQQSPETVYYEAEQDIVYQAAQRIDTFVPNNEVVLISAEVDMTEEEAELSVVQKVEVDIQQQIPIDQDLPDVEVGSISSHEIQHEQPIEQIEKSTLRDSASQSDTIVDVGHDVIYQEQEGKMQVDESVFNQGVITSSVLTEDEVNLTESEQDQQEEQEDQCIAEPVSLEKQEFEHEEIAHNQQIPILNQHNTLIEEGEDEEQAMSVTEQDSVSLQ